MPDSRDHDLEEDLRLDAKDRIPAAEEKPKKSAKRKVDEDDDDDAPSPPPERKSRVSKSGAKRRAKSGGQLSTGVWSNLKSPECTIRPTGVEIPNPTPSGMLWQT